MILASFGLRPEATLADWGQAAAELNRIAATVGETGLQMGFHNHTNEFKEIDGVLLYDELMHAFDPALVKMQFQVAVISLGFEALLT
jgi:hypothetical protein